MKAKGLLLPLAITWGILLAGWGERAGATGVRLLSKDDGPFLVSAREYRGPDAEADAKALAIELARDHGLRTYLYRVDAPGHGTGMVVFVGDAATAGECHLLCRRVGKIKPKCLADLASHRADLTRAIRVTNPLAPAK